MGQMQATHSVIYSDPSLCFHTELWMKLKPKTVETFFCVGVGVWGRRSKGKGREGNFDEMRLACPALEAVQALSKQPTQQHHPALRVVPSLNVKWAMDVKACQACHYLSLCFYCFFILFFYSACNTRKLSMANLANLNFPLVCDDAIK